MRSSERMQAKVIEVCKPDDGTRSSFWGLLDNQVVYYPDWESFQAVAADGGIGEVGSPAYLGFSTFDIYFSQGGRATLISPVIHINKVDFCLGGRNYKAHIPFIVEHEKREIWEAVCGCFESDEIDPKAAEEYNLWSHHQALVMEYEAAIAAGKGGDHLKFVIDTICRWEREVSQRALSIFENRKAFREAQMNLGLRRSARLSGGIWPRATRKSGEG